MQSGISRWVLAGALALGGAAHAQGTQPKADMSKSSQLSQKLGVEIPSEPKAFLERLHKDNQDEIKLAQLAKDRASDKDVRDYADMLVRDHQQLDEKVLAQAKKLNVSLGEPQPANDVERKSMAADEANAAKLQTLHGEAFDSCYLSNMVGDHDRTLGKLVLGEQQFKQGDLGAMLKEAQQKVSHHRDRAYKLLGEQKPSTS